MNEHEIKNQIKQLEREYSDLRAALNSLTNNLSNTTYLRGTLSSAGSAAELILKCIYRREKVLDAKIPPERAEEIKKQESEKLMLDDLIRNAEPVIPVRISTHLRTIQAWRNIGSHNKGEINDAVNVNTLQVVSSAMNELVIWFVGEYLKQDISNFAQHDQRMADQPASDALEQWAEAYWYAMRDGIITRLEQSQLDFLAKKLDLPQSERDKIIAAFARSETDFKEFATEILGHAPLTAFDFEHLDHLRKECCVSVKEAAELLPTLKGFSQISLPTDLDIPWVNDLLQKSQPANSSQGNSASEPKNSPQPPPVPDSSIQDFTVTVNGVSFKMIAVQGGTFTMGDMFGDKHEDILGDMMDNYEIQHQVSLNDYFIGETPVTQELWKAVMGYNPSHFKGSDDLPVESVSWDDAQDFIQKLNRLTDRHFRLPTEAEWEYAARERGRKVRFGNGKDVADPREMNFSPDFEDWEEEYSVAGVDREQTTPVKKFPPNALGLYDISGNILECCSDWHGNYPTEPQQNPKGPHAGSFRVTRGGSWLSIPQYCRVSDRGSTSPGYRCDDLGFRLASQ
jgi:formylglycine-generating enzyme required for sulfatase activity